VHQWGRLNTVYRIDQTMSIDDLSAEQKKQAKQYAFWTAVAIIGGYVILFVI
jgi:hypothetical protein